MIVVIDFGGQTAHLIARRLKELGAKTKIVLPKNAVRESQKREVVSIVFSGGPASVYSKNSPHVDKKIFSLNKPILGICYGLQLIAYLLDGNVKPGEKKEFGPARVKILSYNPLLKGLPKESGVWMSHGDKVVALPKGFKLSASTSNTEFAGAHNPDKKIYAIQFHPEVIHTEFGMQVLENFMEISKLKVKKEEMSKNHVNELIEDIKDSIGNKKAICALSGGVDSSVAALLVYRAIKNNLTSVYIDSGLMREGETEELRKTFKNKYHMPVKIVNARSVFLKNLKGVVDPEKKRKIIGETFIQILEQEAKKVKAELLVQGTIYPDVIESSGTKHSHKIKTHHNVGGLPKKMKLILLEPLRNFYKDEVRVIGKILGLSDDIVKRQPFPGPGLAIRIVGDVTEKKLSILKRADKIIRDEVKKEKLDKKYWQIFAVYTGIKTTGVRGDMRAYGETIAIRALEAKDAMTARWANLPYSFLDHLSVRITNEIKEVNRVVYDITNKPPATMEWE